MHDALEELLARGIQALEAGDHAAVERLCAEHPQHASELRRQLGRLGDAGLLSPATPPSEMPERVGPYRVLEPLGHGGMGSVFLAEQTEPVRRQVALKVIRLGMDSREVLARFERERQALARMSHPNIAMVFDAGITEQGRPFFAMEYVPGVPITTYCERHALSTAARLRLLAQVCEAVQHAHHKGVIHRDLKPSNVLVTEHQGVPTAKVIDFGVAKAMTTDADAEAATLQTRVDQILGTPEYMSPEQATRAEIDSRTDVYALGVLLYELLTGELPFAPQRLRESPDALRRIIGGESPPTPSSRVGTRHRQRRRAPPGTRVWRNLRGDLDWITLKALAKDRDDRYPTPHDLAEDLRRHLADEPVVAGPPSGWYRARKFVRRYGTQVAAATAVLLALVAGLVVSLLFWADARANARRAEANFAEALAAVDELLTQVGDERLAGVPRMERARRALLERALAFYRRFADRRRDDATLRFETVRAYGRVAGICQLLGDHAAADAAWVQSLELLAAMPPSAAQRFELARARVGRSRSWRQLHRDGAIELLRSGLSLLEELHAEQPGVHAYAIAAAAAHNGLGKALNADDPGAARAAFEAAIAEAAAVAAATGALEDRRRAALYRSELGNFLFVVGELQAAEDELRAARTAIDGLVGEAPDDLDVQEALAVTCQHLATLFFRLDSGDPGLLANVDVALPIRERQAAEFPSVPDYRARIAELLLLRARGELFRRRIDEAFATYRTAIERCEALVADFPDVAEHRRRLADGLYRFGSQLLSLRLMGRDGPLDEAEAALRRSLELARELHRREPQAAATRTLCSAAAGTLAQLLFEDGRAAEAAPFSDEELELARAAATGAPDVPSLQRELAGALRMHGQVLHARGDLDGAEQAFRDGLAALERSVAGGGTPEAQGFFSTLYPDLTRTLLAAGRFEAAAEAVRAWVQRSSDDWPGLESAAKTLLECRRLALAADRDDAAAEYAQRAEEHALAAAAVQADLHTKVGGMIKFHIARGSTALLVARAQIARGLDEPVVASVRRALEHAKSAWRGGALDADRLRRAYAAATELLHAAGRDAVGSDFADELQKLLADKR